MDSWYPCGDSYSMTSTWETYLYSDYTDQVPSELSRLVVLYVFYSSSICIYLSSCWRK